jgi:lipopolysaccharide transport system permease protein
MSNKLIIKPKKGWQLIDIKELIEYRELFAFLVWRNIKVLYAQTIMGISWAFIQPVVQIILFTIVFGKVANVATDGLPYVLFSTVAIIPWTYLSTSMSQSSQSLVTGQGMLGKIYFPRLIFPIVPALSAFVDFAISSLLIIGVCIYYHVTPTWKILYIPFFIFMMVCTAIGVGAWLSALAIRFRDIKHAMPFTIRMLMYTAPIVYSASSIPTQYRLIYSINPIVGVIEGFRASLLGTTMQWQFIWPGLITSLVLLISGTLYFRKMEGVFVDVI